MVRDGSEYRAEFTVDRFDAGDLAIGAVSLRGMGHQSFGKLRQDAVACKLTRDGKYIVAAIADGVSDAPLSHLGADVAVRQAIKATETELIKMQGSILRHAIDWASVEAYVRLKILEYAQRLEKQGSFSVNGECNADAYANAIGTTAEVLVIWREKNATGGHDFTRAVLSGDGSGYVLDPQHGWTVLSTGKANDSELASNAIVPLPIKAEGYPMVQSGSIASGQAVIMVTDGIGDVGIGSDNTASRFLHKELVTPIPAHKLLSVLSFVEKHRDDDRTAVIIWMM
jgi:hypothetical protein